MLFPTCQHARLTGHLLMPPSQWRGLRLAPEANIDLTEAQITKWSQRSMWFQALTMSSMIKRKFFPSPHLLRSLSRILTWRSTHIDWTGISAPCLTRDATHKLSTKMTRSGNKTKDQNALSQISNTDMFPLLVHLAESTFPPVWEEDKAYTAHPEIVRRLMLRPLTKKSNSLTLCVLTSKEDEFLSINMFLILTLCCFLNLLNFNISLMLIIQFIYFISFIIVRTCWLFSYL